MVHMDYSLPAVVSLPTLPPPIAKMTATVATTEIPKATETQTQAAVADDDEYDMLEDEDDYDPLVTLSPKVAALSINATPAPGPGPSPLAHESTAADVEMDADTETASETVEQRQQEKEAEASHPFIDIMNKEADDQFDQENLTHTENMATTFRSTKDARLDFFFEVLQGAQPETIQRLAHASWRMSPLDTLRLMFQLRSILDGKGERKGFYSCLEYLRREHPRTLLYNLRFVPDHGYWKDLLNFLVFEVREDKALGYRATSALRKNKARDTHTSSGRGRGGGRGRGRGCGDRSYGSFSHSMPLLTREQIEQIERASKRVKVEKDKDESESELESELESEVEAEKEKAMREKQIKIAENKRMHQDRQKDEAAKARDARNSTALKRLQRARDQFAQNAFYRSVHIEVARLFARALRHDKANMEAKKPVTLAAKWCPSLNQFHDKHTLIATTIAQILFPDRLDGEDDVSYAQRIRQRLRTEYYAPLRKATPVLETFMAAKNWEEIPYSRVPSIAMKQNKGRFEIHDALRFKEYLDSVEKGEKTIAAAALMPHELVVEARVVRSLPVSDPKRRTMELQWQSYVERLKKQPGTLSNCMAMCDVSGSMSGTPMNVAIALSLLLAELTEPPFDSMVLSFSGSPRIHKIKQADPLVDKVRDMERMDWGMNTDLYKAFELILDVAVKNKLPQKDMVKTLFVFSDMEFDQAVSGARSSPQDEAFTNYNVIKQLYKKKGYELPQVVFWNLAASVKGNKPVLATQPGVGMISGYSGMMMKVFLKGDDLLDKLDPIRLMEESINGKAFAKLKVID